MNTRVFAGKIVSATVALCQHSALRPNERVSDAVLLDLGKDLSFRSVRMLLILFELGNRHVYLRAHSGRWSLFSGTDAPLAQARDLAVAEPALGTSACGMYRRSRAFPEGFARLQEADSRVL